MSARELIQAWEGLRLRAYQCPGGVWTIGWGHTKGVTPGSEISVAEAERLLSEDIGEIERQLAELLPGVELGNNRKAALISLIFNIGVGAFGKSSLRRRILANPEDYRIRNEFMRWVRAGGEILPGLVSRRRQEAVLYFGE